MVRSCRFWRHGLALRIGSFRQVVCFEHTFCFPFYRRPLSGLASLDSCRHRHGFIYLGCLPSTVQSSIAFTSVAGGNIAGALFAATLSNVLGVVLCTLMLAGALHTSGDGIDAFGVIVKIAQQILMPFFLGQLLRPLRADLLNRNRRVTLIVDRGSILLIVYSAFSSGVVAGIWNRLSWLDIGLMVLLCVLLLGSVMAMVIAAGRGLAMSRAFLCVLLR